MVISVAAELSVEATDAMVAATKPAATNPSNPGGSNLNIRVGYTRSGCARCGNSRIAQVPGRTMRNSTGSFNTPANNAPQRPSSRLRAASTRCTMNWFVHQ